MSFTLGRGVLVGIVATLSMDLFTGLSKWLGLVAPLPPNLVGRWFAAVARAEPIQADIARLPALRYEMALALPVHYAIGITLACVYLWATTRVGLPARSIGSGLGYGLCTNMLPWLLMFPAMGYGLFGARGPAGTRLFVSSLIAHVFYGLGLWIAARFVVRA